MNKPLALVLGLGVALAGCNDDFLTTVPPDQVSNANFWRTEQDAILAVNAIYPMLYGFEGDRGALYLDNASDNAWQSQAFGGWYATGNGTLDANAGVPAAFWNDSYRAIRRANELLANIDRIQFPTPGLQDRLKGEARFLRAYHYNMLVNLFGDVPLVLTPITVAEGQAARTPAADVVDQILVDLDFAAGVLPISYPPADRGRATKGAALALKARAALYASRWQVAADAAQAVMALGVYSLYPNYRNLFTYAGEGSAEVISDEQFVQNLRTHAAFREFGPRSAGTLSRSVPLRSLVDDYYMTDGLPITQSPLYQSHPDSQYLNRDPRLAATMLIPGAPCSFCVSVPPGIFNSRPDSVTWARRGADMVRRDIDATATGFTMLKYVDPADAGGNMANSGINIILIRYADVLLMYVEAKVELNQHTDAMVETAFNLVRSRAGMPTVAVTGLAQAQARDLVRHERRVELALEGLRLFDIRRWRIAEQVMQGQSYGFDYFDQPSGAAPGTGTQRTYLAELRRFAAPRDYLWPIPSRELGLNPNLTQNPGY